MMLTITNGQSGIEALQNAGIKGTVISWDDVLHDGPVRAGLSLVEQSIERAGYIASCGWGDLDEISSRFERRDAFIENAGAYDEIVLFFEHDLYDQLQLLQVVSVLPESAPVFLAIPATYIGHSEPEALSAAFQARQPLTIAQREYASNAWGAFTASQPEGLIAIASDTGAPLVHVPPAFRRLIEAYPGSRDGLSRTERFVLTSIDQGICKPAALFRANQASEEAVFMGDSSFWLRLAALWEKQAPLIDSNMAVSVLPGRALLFDEIKEASFVLTPLGLAVRAGDENWLRHRTIDKWIGGVRLHGRQAWCWNEEASRFEPFETTG